MSIVKIYNYLGMVVLITYGSKLLPLTWCGVLIFPDLETYFGNWLSPWISTLKGFPVLRPTWI
jgi:hypothetical protein